AWETEIDRVVDRSGVGDWNSRVAARTRSAKIEFELVGLPGSEIDRPVAVEIARDRKAAKRRRDRGIAGIDHIIVVGVEEEMRPVEESRLIAVGKHAIKIASNRDSTAVERDGTAILIQDCKPGSLGDDLVSRSVVGRII